MPVDYTAQLEALRKLYERVQRKDDDIPDEEYAAAGVKLKARLKDIEKQIGATKKRVSAELKKETNEEIEKELEELAKENNMTVEEFKESLMAAEKGAGSVNHKKQQQARAEERDKKETSRRVARGDFDLEVDFV